MRIRRRLLFLTRSRALSGPTAGKGSNCQILTTTLPYLAVIGRSRPVRGPTLCRPLLFTAISTARLTARDPLPVTRFGSRPSRPRPLLHCGDDLSFPAYKDSAHSPLTAAYLASFYLQTRWGRVPGAEPRSSRDRSWRRPLRAARPEHPLAASQSPRLPDVLHFRQLHPVELFFCTDTTREAASLDDHYT
jgi:hypothetical protein